MVKCAAIILAGGMSRRMQGADKAFLHLGDQTLLQQVLARIQPQCEIVLLSANGNLERFQAFDLPILPDNQPVSLGPLAGVLAGMEWLAIHKPGITHMVSLPVDTPFIPNDLLMRLAAVNALATATSGGNLHHAITNWPLNLTMALRHQLIDQGRRSVRAFLSAHETRYVDWPAFPHDPFFNINSIEDLVKAEQWLDRPTD